EGHPALLRTRSRHCPVVLQPAGDVHPHCAQRPARRRLGGRASCLCRAHRRDAPVPERSRRFWTRRLGYLTFLSAATSPSGSATVTVSAEWSRRPMTRWMRGSKWTQTPACALVPKVSPSSMNDKRGPTAVHHRYGPATCASRTVDRGTSTRNGP